VNQFKLQKQEILNYLKYLTDNKSLITFI
jgi:hypothetical protein